MTPIDLQETERNESTSTKSYERNGFRQERVSDGTRAILRRPLQEELPKSVPLLASRNAATDIEGMTFNNEFRHHGIREPLGCPAASAASDVSLRCVNMIRYSSPPRRAMVFAGPSAKPLCNILQEEVADRMSQRVVDIFEPVEVEKQKRDLIILPTGACQRLLPTPTSHLRPVYPSTQASSPRRRRNRAFG
jgi:hypothetical protein